MIKKIGILFISFFFLSNIAVYAVNFERKYQIEPDTLLITTLSAVSSLKFTIKEINSEKGEILFTKENNEFLAKIIKNGENSEIRIVPTFSYKDSKEITNSIFLKLDRKYARTVK